MVVFGKSAFYSGNVGSARQGVCIRAKVVVFGQSDYIRAKLVVFWQKWLYSGKTGFIRAKVAVFGQKWLYSGKSGLFGQKRLY